MPRLSSILFLVESNTSTTRILQTGFHVSKDSGRRPFINPQFSANLLPIFQPSAGYSCITNCQPASACHQNPAKMSRKKKQRRGCNGNNGGQTRPNAASLNTGSRNIASASNASPSNASAKMALPSMATQKMASLTMAASPSSPSLRAVSQASRLLTWQRAPRYKVNKKGNKHNVGNNSNVNDNHNFNNNHNVNNNRNVNKKGRKRRNFNNRQNFNNNNGRVSNNNHHVSNNSNSPGVTPNPGMLQDTDWSYGPGMPPSAGLPAFLPGTQHDTGSQGAIHPFTFPGANFPAPPQGAFPDFQTGAPGMGAPDTGATSVGPPTTEPPAAGPPGMGAPGMGSPPMMGPLTLAPPALGSPAIGPSATGPPAIRSPGVDTRAMDTPAVDTSAMEGPDLVAPLTPEQLTAIKVQNLLDMIRASLSAPHTNGNSAPNQPASALSQQGISATAQPESSTAPAGVPLHQHTMQPSQVANSDEKSPRVPTPASSSAGRATRIRDPIQPPSAASGGIPEPTPEYLLGASFLPMSIPWPKPLLVVIDLNGTLLYRPNSRNRPSGYVERRDAREFLRYCVENFKCVVWSSARPANVQALCRGVFGPPDSQPGVNLMNRLVAMWGRDKFDLSPQDYNSRVQCYKRLSKLWNDPAIAASHPYGAPWDQSNTVLIDDSAEKARSEPYNLVQVPEFIDSPDDDPWTLVQVRGYLDQLRYQADVSTYMRESPFRLH